MYSSISQNWEKLLRNFSFQTCNTACEVQFNERNNYEKNEKSEWFEN